MNDLTPSVRSLMIHRMSVLAIPNGGGLAAGAEFFSNPDKRKRIMDESHKWTLDAIALIRNAPEPNPWKQSTDEDIAAEILRRAESK